MNNRKCFIRLFLGLSLGWGAMSLNAQTVSKTFKNEPLKTVLKEVENQTGYSVIYKTDEVNVNKRVTVSFNNTSLNDVMSKILDSGLTWSIEDKMIVISKKTQPQTDGKKRTVSGIILDKNGDPIIGASILVKGTTNGTITDLDGKYNLANVPENSTLEISYIGYKTQSLKATDKSLANITLHEDTEVLDEVVVVGYTPMRKSDFTGSLASVKANELSLSAATAGQALVGKVAGVQVMQTTGAPGQGVSIKVRGTNSLSASTDPLYVIDGYPASEDVYINPDDIETIDVLKDAASAAIYGSRGASGVVLITTKRGSSGKAKITYDFQYSVQQVSKKIDLLDAYQFRDLVIEARNNAYRDKAEAAGVSWSPLDDNAIRSSKGFALSEVGISDLFFDFTLVSQWNLHTILTGKMLFMEMLL